MPGIPGGSGPNAVGEFYVPATAPSWSPITFTQSVDAVTTVTAVEQKQIPKTLAVVLTDTVVAQKQVNKPLAAATTVTPALATRLTKFITFAATSVVAAVLSTKLLKGVTIAATSVLARGLTTLFVKAAAKSAGWGWRKRPVSVRFRARFRVATFIEAHPPVRRKDSHAVMGVRPAAPRPAFILPWPAVVRLADVSLTVPEALRRLHFGARLTAPERPQPVALRPRIAIPAAPDDEAELIAALIAAGLLQ